MDKELVAARSKNREAEEKNMRNRMIDLDRAREHYLLMQHTAAKIHATLFST